MTQWPIINRGDRFLTRTGKGIREKKIIKGNKNRVESETIGNRIDSVNTIDRIDKTTIRNKENSIDNTDSQSLNNQNKNDSRDRQNSPN